MIKAKNSGCLVSLGDFGANEAGTGQKIDAPLTYPDSRSVRGNATAAESGMEMQQREINREMLRNDIDARAKSALRFVKVDLTEGGYLSEVSIIMLMVELRRSGIMLMDAGLTVQS